MDFETIDDAVSAYVSILDELDRVRKEFKKHEADSKSYLEKIEMWILGKANELGMERKQLIYLLISFKAKKRRLELQEDKTSSAISVFDLFKDI